MSCADRLRTSVAQHYSCLSVRQPWADLIVGGVKDVENRKWASDFRGLLLIHAPRSLDEPAIHDLLPQLGAAKRADYHPVTGAIIGYTTMVDCVERHRSRFFRGPYGFVLAEAHRFPHAVPFAGRLGIFEVPADVLREHGCELPRRPGPERTSSWL